MKTKEEIRAIVREGLEAHVITADDVREFLGVETVVTEPLVPARSGAKSFVQAAIFYIVGIVLYFAVMSAIWQMPTGSFGLHVVMSVGFGVAAWITAYMVGRQNHQDEVREHMTGALLLLGSLLLATGAFYITREVTGDSISLYNVIPGLVVLSLLHAGGYALMRRSILFVLGVFLSVSAVGSLALGLVSDLGADWDVRMLLMSLAIIGSFGLLVSAQRTLAGMREETIALKPAFDEFAVFFSLLVMYINTYMAFAGVWYIFLVLAIFGLFYLSIRTRKRTLLITASFFLVLTILSVSFRYFTDFGVTASLIASAIGLLGVGVLATNLNKRYGLR